VQQISADGRFLWDGAAWHQISDDRRWFWDGVRWQPMPAAAAPGPPAMTAPAVPGVRALVAGPCWVCGGEPGIPVTLRHVTAFVVFGITKTLRAVLCSTCGRALFRQYMNRTLATGWWGVIHFFINCFAVISNTLAWDSLRRLPDPTGASARALPPGRPLYLNFGLWITAAAVVLVVGLGAAGVVAGSQPFPAADQALVGDCVNVAGTTWSPVNCSQTHSGKITSLAHTASGCPVGDRIARLDDDNYVCIDTSK
jgi:hypothetical protein